MGRVTFKTNILAAFLFIVAVSCTENSSTGPELTLDQELQKVLNNNLETFGGTGVSAAIVFQDQSTWLGAGGTSFGTTAISTDMLLGVGSISKTYIAALCLQLAEEGLFSLDDSLHEWLPEYPNVDNSITIRQLLNNSSGIYNITDNVELWNSVFSEPSKFWTPEELISTFLSDPYDSPGAGWYYSNTDYILLGKIINEAAGASVSDELRRRFLKPLGLNNTFLAVEETMPSNIAHGWFDISGDGQADDVSLISSTGIYSALWTSGAIFSTAEDLAHFSSALFQGNMISQSSLNQMKASYYIMPGTTDVGLGMGLYIIGPNNNTAARLWGYTGRTPGYLASMFYLPDYRTSVAVIINDDNSICLDAITTQLIITAIKYSQ